MNFDASKPSIEWKVPSFVIEDGSYDKVNIYRSETENGEYEYIDTIDALSGDTYINTYTDETEEASRHKYYLIKYYKTIDDVESKWLTTFFNLTPKEKRLVDQIRGYIDSFTKIKLSDFDVRNGIFLAISQFNLRSPITNFTLDNFPKELEFFLIMLGSFQTILSKYLDVSIRDYSSSDSGLSLNIDRGSKLINALNQLQGQYDSLITIVKLNYAPSPIGLGTIALPISLGGNLGRNIMKSAFSLFEGIA